VLAAGRGCRGGLCEETTSSSWFQPAPVDAPQDTAEPVSQIGDTPVKTCLRKGGKCSTGRRGWKTKSEKQQCKHQGQK